MRRNEMNDGPTSSHRGSLASGELETITEKEPMTSTESIELSPKQSAKEDKEVPTNSKPKRGRSFFASRSARGGSFSMPFLPKPAEHRTESENIFLETISVTLSGLYCKLLAVVGIAVPVANIFSRPAVKSLTSEGFYIYLYAVSMLYLVFVYSTMLKQHAVATVLHTAATASPPSSPQSEEFLKLTIQKSQSRYGSFYLRMGAAAFGIGSMIYSGLEVGQYIELLGSPQCRHFMMIVMPLFRTAFVIIQIQFVFVSDKQKTLAEYSCISKFGLMHMIATNLCVWFGVVIEEIQHQINNYQDIYQNDNSSHLEVLVPAGLSLSTNLTECRKNHIMVSLVRSSAPFLCLCTIEYSLICSVILYALWKSLCSGESMEGQSGAYANKVPTPVVGLTSQHFTVDCANAHKGLFASIIVLVYTIISLILFFVLVKEKHLADSAILQINVCEQILYILGILATITAMHKIKQLKYKKERTVDLDMVLLVSAQVGLYVFLVFSLLASYYSQDNFYSSPNVFLTSAAGIIQSTLQTLFIVDAWWRRCTTVKAAKDKPARQLVTFLLLANVAMWSINHLEDAKANFHPVEARFYGAWTWSILTQISVPLAVFYRFHCTVCLCEIWKTTYKMRARAPV